jgi:hypothetical protein
MAKKLKLQQCKININSSVLQYVGSVTDLAAFSATEIVMLTILATRSTFYFNNLLSHSIIDQQFGCRGKLSTFLNWKGISHEVDERKVGKNCGQLD